MRANVQWLVGGWYTKNAWYLPKFDGYLEIQVKDGKISGTYIRGGPYFDWVVEWTYDSNGNVKGTIDSPVNLGISLEGKITKK